MHTQLGRNAALSHIVVDEPSPLQRQANRAAQLIGVVAMGSASRSSRSVISSPD
jgi:hypothetical protein